MKAEEIAQEMASELECRFADVLKEGPVANNPTCINLLASIAAQVVNDFKARYGTVAGLCYPEFAIMSWDNDRVWLQQKNISMDEAINSMFAEAEKMPWCKQKIREEFKRVFPEMMLSEVLELCWGGIR